MQSRLEDLPVAVLGAGPVGLAAAAELAGRNVAFEVFERGDSVGHAIRHWQHVELFSPWRYCLADSAVRLLTEVGWAPPDLDELPTGEQLVSDYLEPLAKHPSIAPALHFGSEVVSVTRLGLDKVKSEGRDERPFEITLKDGETFLAKAVIDATGTWFSPNPLGPSGLPVRGEKSADDYLHYGIPDVEGTSRSKFGGKRTLVVGSGHSAINSVLALLRLSEAEPATSVLWAMRRSNITSIYGGGDSDGLPARGALGKGAQQAIASEAVQVLAPFTVAGLERNATGVVVSGTLAGKPHEIEVDAVVVATGFRPDLTISRELRLDLDPWLESSRALGPLIDPNIHSCGTVPPHGYMQLTHPEKDFFVVGMKSYGRAPTFLMATGYEQVRSVVAHLAGDEVAAREVNLVLPETGVCSGRPGDDCCGGTAVSDASACCVLDEQAKAAGLDGCGCSNDTLTTPVFVTLGEL